MDELEKEVVIKGAEHKLKEVAIVKALVDINKIVEPKMGVNKLDDIKLVAYDSEGKIVKDVEMEPSKLSAEINIESPKKEVPIKIIPTGELEFGKAIDDITTNINKVTVYGNQDILDELDYLPVEVDVTGLNENKTYDVIISKPSGIKEVTSNNVKSLIKYIEENFEKPLSVNLACGEEIDLDFFLSVNTVLNDLSLNSKKR